MSESEPIKKVSIICAHGGLEEVYPALILANGARMEGIEASIFFTFFGLNAIMKKKWNSLKVATVGNPSLNLAMPMLGMPITWPFPTLLGAIPGVSDFATHLMKNEMEKLDIPPVPEFLEMIHDAGGEIYACKLAMDMFKLTREDLVEPVDAILTVGEFYEHSAGATVLFT
ncbi:MAG: DsrE/DsrF/DrsH-like family protein [Fidelibacterota bacterium]